MHSLSLFEFQQLSLDKQVDLLTAEAQYLAWKSEGEYNVYLYKFEDFFAEAWMHLRMSRIMRISCSRISSSPEGYDKEIKIS
ncbi:hypothetical protein HZR84_03865 [Hyphobacterium sp. CCMP332]|nr:hypothetical protein HZR84_03865 [Hyphobacterium sp. CCMP332]